MKDIENMLIGFENAFYKTRLFSQNTYPPSNIYKDGDDTVVEIAVAGFKKSDLSVTVDDDVLNIKGTNKSEKDEMDRPYISRSLGRRSFTLKYVLAETAEVSKAKLEDGLLTIVINIPKPEVKQPQVIEIQ